LHYFFGKTASVSTTGIIPNLSGSEEIAGQNSAAPSDENQGISSGALPGGDEYKISFIEDYYKQPPLNYTMHNKPLPVAAKGIYVTANRAGIAEYFDGFFAVCKETEVNALVIDVKTDVGEITFKGEIPIADEMELSVNYIPNVRSVIKTLNDNGIYPIARIVAFKDNGACEKRPDLYIKNADGSLWRDSSSLESAWLNPYNKDSWDYILEIAKGAVDIGFKEIQFDYIRFDTSGRLDDADFGDTGGKTRIEIINEFTKYACEKISGWGAYVSADVYGTVIASEVDANIVGQDYRQMASYLDYICPMVYPSHYANGTFNIDYPDTEPYEVIDNAMKLSAKALEGLEHPAVVRPYLQGFTATWLRNGSRYIAYTPEEIKAQIQAASDNGIGEWIIWNPSANYDAASFEPENNLL
jgi:hypothetical protein